MRKNKKIPVKAIIIISIIVGCILFYVNHMNNYILLHKPREIKDIKVEHREIINTTFNTQLSDNIKINSIIYTTEGFGVELEGITDLKSFINNDLNIKLDDAKLDELTQSVRDRLKEQGTKRDFYYENINGVKFLPATELNININENNNTNYDKNKKTIIIYYKDAKQLCAYLYIDDHSDYAEYIAEIFWSEESVDKYLKEEGLFNFW